MKWKSDYSNRLCTPVSGWASDTMYSHRNSQLNTCFDCKGSWYSLIVVTFPFKSRSRRLLLERKSRLCQGSQKEISKAERSTVGEALTAANVAKIHDFTLVHLHRWYCEPEITGAVSALEPGRCLCCATCPFPALKCKLPGAFQLQSSALGLLNTLRGRVALAAEGSFYRTLRLKKKSF